LLVELTREIRKMSVGTIGFNRTVAEKIRATLTDIVCGNILDLMGPMTAGRLADETGLTTGAITGVIDRMEAAGHARRVGDPKDRRRVVLETCAAGHREVGPLYDSIGKHFAQLLSRYSDKEVAIILDFVTRNNALLREETAKLRASDGNARETRSKQERATPRTWAKSIRATQRG
jgi:DNA-binding MarR family transcriptional regulator